MIARPGPRAMPSSWRAAVAWSQTLVADPAVVFLDTETTGLGPEDEIVEVAVVAADGAVLLDTLVRPSRSIPADATAIHGLRDVDIAEAPAWPEISERLGALLDGRTVVVYNAEFDRRLLRQCCRRHGCPEPEADWQCAMRAYAAFAGEASGRRGSFRWHSLERAAAAFGVPPGGHRALGDALACRGIVLAMAGAGWNEEGA